jgi:hypothetical protein
MLVNFLDLGKKISLRMHGTIFWDPYTCPLSPFLELCTLARVKQQHILEASADHLSLLKNLALILKS